MTEKAYLHNHRCRLLGMFKRTRLITLAFCLMMVSCQSVSTQSYHEDADVGPSPETAAAEAPRFAPDFTFVNEGVTAATNIHYTGQYCSECHETTPVKGSGQPWLKFEADYGRLCRCHAEAPAEYIHPFDIAPSPEKKKRMPADFPLQEGRLTCNTCHNVFLQCEKRLFDRNSLRGAPYPRRTDFCYKCHAEQNYQKLDPHHQIDENGEIIIQNCLICHEEKPDEKHATFKDVKFIGNIETMCRRCHRIAGNHSGNADHMGIKPSPDGMKRIQHMEEKYQVRLPLDEKGEMTCITCHNPHQKGVIPEDRPGAKGADSKYRHRLPENLCKECHQM